MKKFLELFFILTLGISYVIVYDMAKIRSDNECRMEVEDRNIQIETYIKQHKKGRM